jgi:hypothetical protein
MVFGNAQHLLNSYNGSRLAVEEAFILGRVSIGWEEFVPELIDSITLEAARIRLQAMGLLNKDNILPISRV